MAGHTYIKAQIIEKSKSLNIWKIEITIDRIANITIYYILLV